MSDLLEKEKEFHRLNRELGRKTKDLMRQVDSVLISHTASYYPTRRSVSDCRLVEPTIFPGTENSRSADSKHAANGDGGDRSMENVAQEETAASDAENPRNDAFVRFLKAKIKLLDDEVQTVRTEYKKKCNYCKELELENKKLLDSRTKLGDRNTALKETISKLESNNASIQTELQTRNGENSVLNKEIDHLKNELRASSLRSSNFDARLNRSLEEIERLRNVVKLDKIEGKELRDRLTRQRESERLSTKNLERQRTELLQAFKKQTSLVDNLKRQKAHLEASRMVQLSEEEFSKLLDWSPENA